MQHSLLMNYSLEVSVLLNICNATATLRNDVQWINLAIQIAFLIGWTIDFVPCQRNYRQSECTDFRKALVHLFIFH